MFFPGAQDRLNCYEEGQNETSKIFSLSPTRTMFPGEIMYSSSMYSLDTFTLRYILCAYQSMISANVCQGPYILED